MNYVSYDTCPKIDSPEEEKTKEIISYQREFNWHGTKAKNFLIRRLLERIQSLEADVQLLKDKLEI